jgi:aromatic-L-amino-acid decarboxylase
MKGETEDARATRLDALNEAILQNVNASGKIFLSHTRLNERFTLRLSIGNIRTTEEHIRQAWELLNEELARHL